MFADAARAFGGAVAHHQQEETARLPAFRQSGSTLLDLVQGQGDVQGNAEESGPSAICVGWAVRVRFCVCKRRVAVRFFMLLGLATLIACGSGEKKAKPDALPATSNMVEGNTPDQSMATPSRTEAAPEPLTITMPDFAPQYPGSIIEAVNSGIAGAADNHEVRLSTRDDAGEIVDFYREKFAAAGLKKTSEFLSGGTGMMSAMGKGRTASIAITKEQDHNAVIVTYSGD